MTGKKVCWTCEVEKPLDGFATIKGGSLSSNCKMCRRAYAVARIEWKRAGGSLVRPFVSPLKPALIERQPRTPPREQKECRVCHVVKPCAGFTRRTANLDGLANECRTCTRAIDLRAETRRREQLARKEARLRLRWPPGHQPCRKCKKMKPLEEYSPHHRSKNGLSLVCKACIHVIRSADNKRVWTRRRKAEGQEPSPS
jgi:hypothetical protein